jgi:putative Holliday junction resolvase|tara:strand:+ start:120 stop:512 length:393 start_codon:yes stop_codon:yes gene_type:complete
VGERRIGLAISDPGGRLATPYSAIRRRDQQRDIAAVLKIAREEEITLIVVGMPWSLDGSVGPQAERTLAFCRALEASSHVPVEVWDERYSSVEAEHRLIEAGVSPSRNRGRVDASAAAVILQAYLDARRA